MPGGGREAYEINSFRIWIEGNGGRVSWYCFTEGGRGGNSSVGNKVGALLCMMKHHALHPHRCRPVERNPPPPPPPPVPLGFNIDSDSTSCSSFGWEFKPKFDRCTSAFHRRDSKDPDIHVLDMVMLTAKTHPPYTIHEDGM